MTPPLHGAAEPTLLSIAGLTKRFTGTLALDAVDFDLRRGEIHALLGQNGAGKSTLIKILAGIYPPDAGTISFRGREIKPGVDRVPVVFIHQDLGLVDTMTVAENVAVGAGYPMRRGWISWPATREAGRAALARMGSDLDPDRLAGGLTAAEKSIVAIARGLAVECEMLVLDEPTAALPEADVVHLLTALDRLRRDGIGMIYVSHRLDETFRIADRVTVLRDGRLVRVSAIGEITPETLVHDIVGRALDSDVGAGVLPATRPLLEVEGLVAADVGPVSLLLGQGEILGLVGLRGGGHDTVGRALFGAIPRDAGEVRLRGKTIAAGDCSRAMRAGFGFVSSKRAEESLAPRLSVRENLFLNPVLTGTSLFQVNPDRREQRRSADLVRRFSIRPPDPERPVGTLSGGNQQKVVVARWLAARIAVLILEEPTIGVDVGSKAEIYALLREATAQGMGVLLISSDFEEVERLCHRAVVFDRGSLGAELSGDAITSSALTLLASGAAPPNRIHE